MMDDFSDLPDAGSSTTEPGDRRTTVPLPSLESGLAALKRKDYSDAIAQLETVCQAATSRTVRIKAQMGLIKAYAQTGAVDLAIALCRPLEESTSQTVRLWATQTLQELTQPSAPVSPPDEAGFTPIAAALLPESKSVVEYASPDATGFVAQHTQLQSAQTTLPPDVPADTTGFTLLGQVPSTTNRQRLDRTLLNPSASEPITSPTSEPTAPTPAMAGTEDVTALDIESDTDNPFIFPGETAETNAVPHASGTSQADDPTPETVSKDTLSWQWRQAERAQKWAMLGTINVAQLWAVQAITAIALVAVVALLLLAIVSVINGVLEWVPFIDLSNLRLEGSIPLWGIVLLLTGLLVASPWLFDTILKRFYGLQALSVDHLTCYSSETARMLKRVCGQRRYPAPTLGLLPTSAPIALTYGCLPQTARIVVSQGLLDQLHEDEIAAIYAGELSHLLHWNVPLMTLVTLTALIPHLAYVQIAAWGDRQHDRVLQSIATLGATLCYGAYRLWRYPGLWLSRLRLYHSDRTATEITGNPNGLTRALLKIAIGLSTEIQRQQQTSALLESIELLTPIGPAMSLSSGSLFEQHLPPSVLEWDRSNPYRHWLAAHHAHAPLGDRLHHLTRYARQWHLPTELEWNVNPSNRSNSKRRPRHFLQQSSPILGILFGLGMAMGLRLVGGIAYQSEFQPLSWLWWDESIVQGCLLLGFSIGTLLQVNPFFPSIKSSNLQTNPSLAQLATPTFTLPVDSQPVRLRGKLIGRRGIGGWLNQDLMLQTDSGVIKLHYTSQFGFIGNILPQRVRPQDLVSNMVVVTGWYRRDVVPWVDVDTIQSQRGSTIKGEHQLLLTYLAGAAGLLSAYVILQG